MRPWSVEHVEIANSINDDADVYTNIVSQIVAGDSLNHLDVLQMLHCPTVSTSLKLTQLLLPQWLLFSLTWTKTKPTPTQPLL